MSKPVAIAIRADHPEAGSRGPFAGYSNIRISVPSGGYGMPAPVAMPDPEARAVIDLLAAAPDMLAALRELHEWLCNVVDSSQLDDDDRAKLAAADSAIAKANGGDLQPATDPRDGIIRDLVSSLREYIGEAQKLGWGSSSLEEMARTAIAKAEGKL